jgi:hypothetical protein
MTDEHEHRWTRGRCRDCGEWCLHPASLLREEPAPDGSARYRCGVCRIIDREQSGYTAPVRTRRNWADGGGGSGTGRAQPDDQAEGFGRDGRDTRGHAQRRARHRRSSAGEQIAANRDRNNQDYRRWRDRRARVLQLLDERPDRLSWREYQVGVLAYGLGYEDTTVGRLLSGLTRSRVAATRLAVEAKADDYQVLLWWRSLPKRRKKTYDPVAREALVDRWRDRPRRQVRGKVEGPPRPWTWDLILAGVDQGWDRKKIRLRWEMRRWQADSPGDWEPCRKIPEESSA